jgi:uncharacterized protein DUF4386
VTDDFERRLLAILSILAGLLSFVLLGGAASSGPPAPGDVLPYFKQHQARHVLAAILVLAWVVTSIPFVVVLRALLGDGRRMLALAATILCAGGIFLLGFAIFTFTGAFLALAAVSETTPGAAALAAQEAAVWAHLSFFLTDPGLMALGFGQLGFAWLAWSGDVFSKRLALVGFVGGIAGALTLAVYQTSVLAAIQVTAFGLWGLAAGFRLLRKREPALRIM